MSTITTVTKEGPEEVTLKILTVDGPQVVRARQTATPGLVVHKTYQFQRTYTLTHAATGMAICKNFRSQGDAALCAEQLGHLPIDWDSPDQNIVVSAPPEVGKAAVDIVKSFFDVRAVGSHTVTNKPSVEALDPDAEDDNLPL